MQGDLPPPHPSVVCGLEKLERSSRSSSFCGINRLSLPLAYQPAFSSSLISTAETLSRGEEGKRRGRKGDEEGSWRKGMHALTAVREDVQAREAEAC